ncbi:Crp/Fnr family transcriptional regulator [Alkaliphilus peptidifermentans]|nr:Crp/Fnr family transcriptional regulator [Alkaliphilus peptidifermentans]
MYSNFFDDNRQSIMREFFINDISTLGTVKNFKKNELIDIKSENYVVIVLKGVISQSVISEKGHEKLLYVLRPGEIFGEMCFFCGGTDSIIAKGKTDGQMSIIIGDVLEKILKTQPEVYKYFMHSVTRKFRIVMLQLTNSVFNDALGKISDALLRLYSCADRDKTGRACINMALTHQELANNIGCSRITVTRCLNKLLDEKVISYEGKYIVINRPDILKQYIDTISCE